VPAVPAVICATALAAPPATPSPAASLGGLLVAPTRLVFDGRTRSAELTLVNTGRELATYRIVFVQMRLTETGGLLEVEDTVPGELFADKLVRYSPRQVELKPGEPQTVRLQLRKPADLAVGEYRSHLVFRAVPRVSAADGERAGAPGMNVSLVPIYGVAVPILVRHGVTAATARLSGLQIRRAEDGGRVLQFRVDREGNRSVYGNFTVTFLPASGPPSVVAIMNGVAVYTPGPTRLVQLALRPPPGLVLRGGRLRLVYAAAEPAERSPEVLASAEIALP
jgi:hypothetical protein